MLSRSQKRVVLGVGILVFVVLFVVPGINVNRYKLSVGQALSQALGRQVTVDDVSIQTFPQPGLLLKNVVVADDPAISAEPMLRAPEMLATIRVSSFWRGRFEIGTLKLDEPSVNLVRAKDGRWNLESLLERARQTSTAPTSKTSPESRARFPYIEADNGRINLKVGIEKKVIALNDAEFSLWLASEDEWRMRLKARPIRTDANLTDTGTVKMEGAWKRASTLHETPFQLRLWWEGGQLGQLTTLVYGRDRGWRGEVQASAVVNGRPDDMKITSDVKVSNFRRYDIAINEPLTLQGHCDAKYSLAEHEISDLNCQSPLGGGLLEVNGSFGVVPKRDAELSISAENVPAQFLSSVLRHAKKDVPEDLSASGMMSATFTVRAGEDGERTWAGNGESSDIEIRSSVLGMPLAVNATRWHLIGPGVEQFTAPVPKHRAKTPPDDMPQPANLAFSFEPVSLNLGGTAPALLRGWFARENYLAELKGDATLERLIEAGRLLGIPTVASDLSGTARGKLDISGTWLGFALPQVTGEGQLQNATVKLNGVARPLSIKSAQYLATPEVASLTKASGAFAEMHSALDFSLEWPRQCKSHPVSSDENCALSFVLKADQIDVDELNSLLNPKAQKRPWYAAIASTVIGSDRKSLPAIYADGHFAVGKLVMKNVTAGKVNGNLRITPQGFTMDTVNGDLLGGKFVGDIEGDFSGDRPKYSSDGNLVTVVVASIASLMHDPWASGKVTASYKGTASGWSADEIIASVEGTANFSWRDGVLHHINLDSPKPLQFTVFTGRLELARGNLTISESKLQTPRSIYLVSGTASLGRDLEMTLARDGAASYSISGTLERPKVSMVKTPETQASLKK